MADATGAPAPCPNRARFARSRAGARRGRNPAPARRASCCTPTSSANVSALPLTRGAVDLFDHPRLFMVPLDRPRTMPAAAKTLAPPAMRRGRARVAPSARYQAGLHRYCSGCAHETEHVVWTADGRGSIPSIRWPTTEPAIGTTICLGCGQWRAASHRPSPPAWSSWPRSLIARRTLVLAVDSADTAVPHRRSSSLAA
jgi:hypothetical protein